MRFVLSLIKWFITLKDWSIWGLVNILVHGTLHNFTNYLILSSTFCLIFHQFLAVVMLCLVVMPWLSFYTDSSFNSTVGKCWGSVSLKQHRWFQIPLLEDQLHLVPEGKGWQGASCLLSICLLLRINADLNFDMRSFAASFDSYMCMSVLWHHCKTLTWVEDNPSSFLRVSSCTRLSHVSGISIHFLV